MNRDDLIFILTRAVTEHWGRAHIANLADKIIALAEAKPEAQPAKKKADKK